MIESNHRHSHACLDLTSRAPKAAKILRLIGLDNQTRKPSRLLEIGTGSGFMAQYMADHFGAACEVHAVDVNDHRQAREGYTFQLITGTTLPFPDQYFDAVISNHVAEHVGDFEEQMMHLHEIRRVMHDSAVAYFAMPSRWQVVEPHYKIAFLSWLPRKVRTPYLRWRKEGTFYDCEPRSRHELERMFSKAEFIHENLFSKAIQAMHDIEPDASIFVRAAAAMPPKIVQSIASLAPTHIYKLLRHRR